MLDLTLVSGHQFALRMSDGLKARRGLKSLANEQAFRTAKLGDAGWTVEWPDLNIQIGADTVFLAALVHAAPDDHTWTSANLAPLTHDVQRESRPPTTTAITRALSSRDSR